MSEKFEPTKLNKVESQENKPVSLKDFLPDAVIDKIGKDVISNIEYYIANEEQDESFKDTVHVEFLENDGTVVSGDIVDYNDPKDGHFTIQVSTKKDGKYSGHKAVLQIDYKKLNNGEYEVTSDAEQFREEMEEMKLVRW